MRAIVRALLLSAAGSVVVSAAPAFAQDTPSEYDGQSQEIIVTASKRAERVASVKVV